MQRIWYKVVKGVGMGLLGGHEIIVVLIVIILLFGAKKIPELAKGLGTGIKEFKKATTDAEKELDVKKEDKDASSKKDEGKSA